MLQPNGFFCSELKIEIRLTDASWLSQGARGGRLWCSSLHGRVSAGEGTSMALSGNAKLSGGATG